MAPTSNEVPRYPWIFPAGALGVASLILVALVAGLLIRPLGVGLACIGLAGYLTGALSVKRPWRGVFIVHIAAFLLGIATLGAWGIYLIFAFPFMWPPFGLGWFGGRAFARWILIPPTRRFA
jgi:hypothetical protein